jgi:hypothetical protein
MIISTPDSTGDARAKEISRRTGERARASADSILSVTTETEVIQLDDDGRPEFRDHWRGGATSGQSWLAAF